MGPAEGQVRLDTVVYRRDRLFEAGAVAAFTALVVSLAWLLLLACFWGLLGQPWFSLVIGLPCTAAIIRWGARLGRGSRERSRRTPCLVITPEEMLVGHVAGGAGTARVPLDAIRVVAIDARSKRQRRADCVRFGVGVGENGPAGWLYCRYGSWPLTATFGLGRTPNVAILFNRPMFIGPDTAAKAVPGFLLALADPYAARTALIGRVQVRPLVVADLDGIGSLNALPVWRLGSHGLREVRPEDRILARVIDATLIPIVFFLLVLGLVPPGWRFFPILLICFALVWFLYEVPSTAIAGQTLGKYVLGLRVVRIEDGSARLGLKRATARALLRLFNGAIAAPADKLARGDAVGRLSPGLSLANGVGASTLVVAEGEYQRMRLTMSARQRERAVTETVIELEHWEPKVPVRTAWIALLFVLLVTGTVVFQAARHSPAKEPSPGVTQNGVSPTPGPPLVIPTQPVVLPSQLPTPDFSIPPPTLPPNSR